MPGIGSLQDLKSAQEEGLDIYGTPYALSSMLLGDGGGLVGKIVASYGWRKKRLSS